MIMRNKNHNSWWCAYLSSCFN